MFHNSTSTSRFSYPGESVCVRAAPDLHNVIWFKDDVAIRSDSILSIREPGKYYYQALTQSNDFEMGCALFINGDNGCNENFTEIQYPIVHVDFSEANGQVSYSTYTPEIIPFEITWTGIGNGTTWDDASNWTNTTVPCPCQHVIIINSQQVLIEIGTTSRIWSLETMPGALLTLDLNALLQVIGN